MTIIFLLSKTCILQLNSVLSSEVFAASNCILFQIIHSRKIPPLARFSLAAAEFHWEGQSGNSGVGVPRVM